MNPYGWTLVGLGIAAIEYGIVLVSVPAAFIVGGCIALVGAILGAEVKAPERSQL